MAQSRKKPSAPPLLEWIASGVGLLLILGMLAVIGRDAFNRDTEQLPAIEVGVIRVARAGAGFVVEIEAHNRSGGAAAAVQIEGALKDGGTEVETSSATLDYVPGRARRAGGLFFTRDPRAHRLEIRALGYQTP